MALIDDLLTELRECRSAIGQIIAARPMLAAAAAGSTTLGNRLAELKSVIARAEEARRQSLTRMPKGFLEVGLSADEREVVANHPDLQPDANGVGHLVFSPAQALEFGAKIIAKAHDCKLTSGAMMATIEHLANPNRERITVSKNFNYEVDYQAADGQSANCKGTLKVAQGDFHDALQAVMMQSFQQITQGKAVFGQPGKGCRGPYQITRFLLQQKADA